MESDAELIKSYRKSGDRGSLSRLFERHRGRAFRVALYVLEDPEDAEDAVQNAFVRLLRYEPRIPDGAAIEGLVVRAAVYAARDLARRRGSRRRRERSLSEVAEPAAPRESDTERERYEAIMDAVEALDDRYRLPMMLRYAEGFSTKEVGEALGISQTAVTTRLSRAVRRVQQTLARAGIGLAAAAILSLLARNSAESAGLSTGAGQSGVGSGAIAPWSGGSSLALAKLTAIGLITAAAVGGAVVVRRMPPSRAYAGLPVHASQRAGDPAARGVGNSPAKPERVAALPLSPGSGAIVDDPQPAERPKLDLAAMALPPAPPVLAALREAPQNEETTPFLSGRVLDRAGKPIGGAILSLFSQGADRAGAAGGQPEPLVITQSLPNGSYVIRIPQAGPYRLDVSAPSYVTAEASVTLPAAGLQYDVHLFKSLTISLRLGTPDGDPAPPGPAEVWLWAIWDGYSETSAVGNGSRQSRAGAGEISNTSAAGNGSWPHGRLLKLSGTVGKDGFLEVALPDWMVLGSGRMPLKDITRMLVEVLIPGSGCGEVLTESWPERSLTIALRPAGVISGEVVGADGKPLEAPPGVPAAGALAYRILPHGVSFLARDAQPDAAKVGKDGHFSMPLFAPGSYVIVGYVPSKSITQEADYRQITVDAAGRVTVTGADSALRLAPGEEGAERTEALLGRPEAWSDVPLMEVLQHLEPARVAASPAISVRMLNAATGAPLRSVMVQAWGWDDGPVDIAYTDADGRCRLRSLGHPCSIVLGDRQYYPAHRDDVQGSTTLTLSASPLPVLHLRVLGPDGRAPVGQLAEISASLDGRRCMVTDDPITVSPGGLLDAYLLPGVSVPTPPGGEPDAPPFQADRTPVVDAERVKDVRAAVRVPGLGWGEAHLGGLPGTPQSITLRPGAALTGVVRGEDGEPGDGGLVIAQQSPGPGDTTALAPLRAYAMPDDHGRFKIPNLSPGFYTVSVYLDGRWVSKNVELQAPATGVDLQESAAPSPAK